MKVNVLFAPVAVDELYFSGKTVVVIDVLRATSSIVAALINGAKEIIPVNSVDFAVKVSSSMFGGLTILAGERNTRKIDGFNLGNSPLEFTVETVSGKSIILFTTNGTKAIVKTKFSERTIISSFLNLSASAKYIHSLNTNLEILCSGRNNLFSIEDTVCAGRLINELTALDESIELSDSAKASVALAKSSGKNIKKMFAESEHGKILIENGFGEDLKFCSRLNITDIIPVFIQNAIKPVYIEKEAPVVPVDEVSGEDGKA